tara:strand:+ start:453 stop:653 length:201 start_codon:yes stop_codon:yes gene_type:complete
MTWMQQALRKWLNVPSPYPQADLLHLQARMDILEQTLEQHLQIPTIPEAVDEGRLATFPDAHLGAQ